MHGNINLISKDSFYRSVCVSLTIFRECFDTFPCLHSDPQKIDHGVSNLGEELRRFDGKLDIRSCEKLETLPMWHTFWKGKLGVGLISFWMSKWFDSSYLISFANNLHLFRFLTDCWDKTKRRHKKHLLHFSPNPHLQKLNIIWPQKKHPVACCHFVKESQVSPPDISSAEQLYRSCSCTITEVKSSHHFRFASHRFGTTWNWRSDPHFFRKSNMSKWEKFTGKSRIWKHSFKEMQNGPESPTHAFRGCFAQRKWQANLNLRYTPVPQPPEELDQSP